MFLIASDVYTLASTSAKDNAFELIVAHRIVNNGSRTAVVIPDEDSIGSVTEDLTVLDNGTSRTLDKYAFIVVPYFAVDDPSTAFGLDRNSSDIIGIHFAIAKNSYGGCIVHHHYTTFSFMRVNFASSCFQLISFVPHQYALLSIRKNIAGFQCSRGTRPKLKTTCCVVADLNMPKCKCAIITA